MVAPSPREAEELAAELAVILGETGESPTGRRVYPFPAWEAPPLEMVSPSRDVQAARTAALYRLASGQSPIVVTSPAAIAVRTGAPEALVGRSLSFSIGDEVLLEDLVARLQLLGYRKTGAVEEPGEAAVRGGIVDLWPPGSEVPARVELLGDTVESIRLFDPVDQRSFGETDELVVLAPMPFDAGDLARREVRDAVALRADELLLPTAERRRLDDALATGAELPGAELLAPYVDGGSHWIADYLPEDALTVVIDAAAIDEAVTAVVTELEDAAGAAADAGTFFPAPELLYVDAGELGEALARKPLLEIDMAEALESGGEPGRRTWRIEARSSSAVTTARARVKAKRGESGFAPIADALHAAHRPGTAMVLLASDATQGRRLQHLLSVTERFEVGHADDFPSAIAADPATVWIVEGHLAAGFSLASDGVTVVTDEEIFGERRDRRRRRRASRTYQRTALAQLDAGDHVVHVDHGIGLYHGLKHIRAAGMEADFLYLEYAGGDRYYLPVDRINLVEKYTGSGSGGPTLDKLGGTGWVRAKKKARESILEMARELLELEAFRAVHQREPWVRVGTDFEEFEALFPFEETEGQVSAIADVVGDFGATSTMDRVVCGDVGYGKTEVAMRAAYLAAMGGRQVAFLVPTTVLARQHYRSLIERFEGYPVKIEMLSRFRSRDENAEAVVGLADGTVDIVVGTHRLLQRDVKFASLGLLVIDEEHRFGVKAKEALKRMRREVDVLTMTATPIPRTLQLALTGVRDLSLIETPPVDRLAIRTYVARYDEGLVRQAVTRELTRGGQVFFVHNRVRSIAGVARRLEELLPGVRIGVGHGQMNERELEKVMLDFLEHRSDVLVCTSIIESGLDIPNANTIIVDRADTFGLAQLYQIRGRVGRSHRRAYAYLLVPGEKLITEEARKRLAVLQELDHLGAGFRLAARDMEIRGAGNLLGKQQSGQIAAIGFDLFMQMMEEATQELRGRAVVPRIEPEIDLGAEAFLPESYIEDVGERLQLYRRMANAESAEAVATVAEELTDRFGTMPRQAADFVRVMALRPALKRLLVESLKSSGNVVALRFHEASPVDRSVMLGLATGEPRRYRLRPDGPFTMKSRAAGWDDLVDEIERLLATLTEGLSDEATEDGGVA